MIEREHLIVPIDSLVPNEYNPNRMDEATLQAERESIEEYGFIDPVTVWLDPSLEVDSGPRYRIIDGEHRWRVARELLPLRADLNLDELPIYLLHGITSEQAMKLTIIMNETRGEADPPLLGKVLAELNERMDTDEFRRGLRFDDAELDHLLKLASHDWDQYGGELPRDDDEPPDEWFTLVARIPESARPVWAAALDRAGVEHEDADVRAGLTIELIAGDYIAGPSNGSSRDKQAPATDPSD